MSNQIYVQIASYRDPQLIPTITDCIRRADNPEDLIFGIAWQHSKEDEWDNLDIYKDDPRFRIIDIDSKDSKGTCWARHMINEQYAGEAYTLQIDSHHRFVRGWDTKCKRMLADLVDNGYKKPLLTTYCPTFDPENDPAGRMKDICRLNFDRFMSEGTILISPGQIDKDEVHELPIPTRFFSGHFMFTTGNFIREVPYDPNLYFHGEEISMAVRAYTHGYDLFVPNELVCWHEYTRKGRVRHWDDNSQWNDVNKKALKRVNGLLSVDGEKLVLDQYGLGTVRNLFDYEQYSGIRFADRSVQQYTLNNFDPPNPLYRRSIFREGTFKHMFKHTLDIWRSSLPEPDYDFWAIIFVDEEGEDINRHDMTREDIEALKGVTEGDVYHILREFETQKKPHKWIVWPHSVSKGWGTQLEGILPRV